MGNFTILGLRRRNITTKHVKLTFAIYHEFIGFELSIINDTMLR